MAVALVASLVQASMIVAWLLSVLRLAAIIATIAPVIFSVSSR